MPKFLICSFRFLIFQVRSTQFSIFDFRLLMFKFSFLIFLSKFFLINNLLSRSISSTGVASVSSAQQFVFMGGDDTGV